MCCKFRPLITHLPRSWLMDLWLPGAIQKMVVTALRYKISWEMCSKFQPQLMHLPQFWLMDLSLPGAIQTMVVTAPQFKISSGMWGKFRQQILHLPPSWWMGPWFAGAIETMAVTVCSSRPAEKCSANSGYNIGICRFLGWWIRCYLGRTDLGGDCSEVQDQLRNVQQIQATASHLPRSWLMDPLLPGASQTWVVTARKFKTSSGMCSKFSPQTAHLPRSWLMDRWLLGAIRKMVVTAP